MLHRRPCSGVDKLILAAMMEDSAAAAMAHAQAPVQASQHQHHLHHHHHHQGLAPSGYLPSGRGIGYLNMRDAAMEVPTPSNKSELELYRLLERANLLSYFGIFLNFGGDDVQQLSDADEEEFLEIMGLVGMTQKPLHVRRFQKALIEWRENREMDTCFKVPTINHSGSSISSREFNCSSSGVHCNDNSRRQASPDPSILVESPATTPNSFKSMTTTTTTTMTTPSKIMSFTGQQQLQQHQQSLQQQQQQNYALPHEALIGAPKRLRLMDNMLLRSPKDATKSPPKQSDEQTRNEAQQDSNCE